MSSLTLDHVILVVSNVQVASQQFAQLGFSVIPGGTHSGGLTHNALVTFQDGSYLELLSTTRPSRLSLLILLKRLRLLSFYIGNETAINRRLINDLAGGIGMADFCMGTADLQEQLNLVRLRGAQFSNPIPGGRMRPDGQQLAWRTSVPRTYDLPFLIDDQTPRDLRVPPTATGAHENGILGIQGLVVLVSNLVESMARYRALLGDDPTSQAQYPQPGTQSSEFILGDRFISLLSPLPGNTGARQLLKYRLSRPVGVFFKSARNGERDLLCLTYLPDQGLTLSRSRTILA